MRWLTLASPTLALVSVALLLVSACSEPIRPHVVIVLFDTLRRDHVGTYGYARDTTPNLDAIAEEGLVFEQAIAQSSWTRPSVASLFTSRYHSDFHPDVYSLGPDAPGPDVALPEGALTLAEIFASSGYRTVAATTNVNLHPMLALDQGFETKSFRARAAADWVVDRGLEAFDAIRSDPRPVFAYLHFMEPHPPFDAPEPYASMFPTSDGKPHRRGHIEFSSFADFGTEEKLRSEAFRAFRSHVIALYDGGIRFGDAEVARLVAGLEERGQWDDTIFVFLSDHGESFWDRPLLEKRLGLQSFLRPDLYGVGHGHTLFPEQVDVPLVLRGPGVPVGRVAAVARLIDVGPTLLALAGVSHEEFEPRGVDLLAGRALEGARSAYSEVKTKWGRQRSVQTSKLQYVEIDGEREAVFRKGGSFESVADPSLETLSKFRAELKTRGLAGPPEADVEAKRLEFDAEVCRELAQLGYVEPDRCSAPE